MQLVLLPIVHRVLIPLAFAARVHRIAPYVRRAVLAVLVYCVEIDADLFELRQVAIVIRNDALARFERCVSGRHSFAHHLNHRVSAVDLDDLFSSARRSSGSDFIVYKQPAADQRRVAYAAGELMKQAAGRGRA